MFGPVVFETPQAILEQKKKQEEQQKKQKQCDKVADSSSSSVKSTMNYTAVLFVSLSSIALLVLIAAGIYEVSHLFVGSGEAQLTSILAVLISVSWLIYHQSGLDRPKNAPPLKRSWIPYVGHWYEFWADPVEFLRELKRDYGNVVSVLLAGKEHIFIFEPSFVRPFMLKAEHELPQVAGVTANGTFVPLMGENLPVTRAEQERMKSVFKRKMTPLARKLTLDFGSTMQKIIDRADDEGVWNSTEMFYDTMIRLGAIIILGEEMVEDPEFHRLAMGFKNIVSQTEKTMSIGWPLIFLKARKLHKDLRTLFMPIITERRKLQVANPDNWLQEHKLKDLVSLAMNEFFDGDGESLDAADADNRVLIIAANFMFGLIANTPTVAEHLLAQILADRDLKADIEEEVRSVCSANPGQHLWEIPRTDFKVLAACAIEEMRVNPDLTISRGVIDKPFNLPNGFVAPVGSVLQISPKILHDDITKRDEPLRFDPRRMAEDGMTTTFGSVPFLGWGYGRHACPGMNVAKNQINVVNGMLLKNFDMELLDDLPDIHYDCRESPALQRSVRIKFTRRDVPLGEDSH